MFVTLGLSCLGLGELLGRVKDYLFPQICKVFCNYFLFFFLSQSFISSPSETPSRKQHWTFLFYNYWSAVHFLKKTFFLSFSNSVISTDLCSSLVTLSSIISRLPLSPHNMVFFLQVLYFLVLKFHLILFILFIPQLRFITFSFSMLLFTPHKNF